MEVTVHRGTRQIGGCVVEVCAGGTRLLIDAGEDLPGPEGAPAPAADFLAPLTKGCDAVLFTHYHGDHVGRLCEIDPAVPVYMGPAAKEILACLYARVNRPALPRVQSARTFRQGVPFALGAITVTPLMVDHSAYDAYMFLLEADGKKVLHTGDFRTHGYRGKGVLPALRKYVGEVDLLITEGTMLSRDGAEVPTEAQMGREARRLLQENKYLFLWCSSTNIDRIAGFCANLPRGKYFVCDGYQKQVLEATQKYAKPYSGLYDFSKALVYGDNLPDKMQARGCCMLVRGTPRFQSIMDRFDPAQSLLVYSLWRGYLDRPETGYADFLQGRRWQYLHTSGHATKEALQAVCNTVKPRQGVVVIHTEAPAAMEALAGPWPCVRARDGQVIAVG